MKKLNRTLSSIERVLLFYKKYCNAPLHRITILNFDPMNQGFGKKEKLKSKTLITQLFKEGKSITRFPLKLIYLPVDTEKSVYIRTGVSVPKRNFRKAVERIHIKRLMREAYRKNKYLVIEKAPSSYAFMLIYIGKKQEDFNRLSAITEELFKKFVEKELK